MEEKYSLVEEFTNTYKVEKINDDETKITILVPQKYLDLWMVKISELTTTDSEIESYI